MRIDHYLVEQGFIATRAKAQDAIREGRVCVNSAVITKNSYQLKDTDRVELQQAALSFVSRAGFKLYDVLDDFSIKLKNRICIDVGASTGGFSDVCLKQGASKVYAVDVGTDQLDSTLRKEAKLICMEQMNARHLNKEMFDELPDFACMDVSFISVKHILPALKDIMSNVEMVVLVKPQFEAGKEHIGKHGIIKDKKVHVQVLKDMLSYVQELGLFVHHIQGSSILGRDGNKEFVMHVKQEPKAQLFDIKKIVEEDHTKR